MDTGWALTLSSSDSRPNALLLQQNVMVLSILIQVGLGVAFRKGGKILLIGRNKCQTLCVGFCNMSLNLSRKLRERCDCPHVFLLGSRVLCGSMVALLRAWWGRWCISVSYLFIASIFGKNVFSSKMLLQLNLHSYTLNLIPFCVWLYTRLESANLLCYIS